MAAAASLCFTWSAMRMLMVTHSCNRKVRAPRHCTQTVCEDS